MDKGFKFMTAGEYMSIQEGPTDMIEYVVEYDEAYNCHSLFSVVPTNFGGPAKNWITSGSKDECMQKMEQMKALDELAQQAQDLGMK